MLRREKFHVEVVDVLTHHSAHALTDPLAREVMNLSDLRERRAVQVIPDHRFTSLCELNAHLASAL